MERTRERSGGDEMINLDNEMAEVSLLLPNWQISALADAAQSQGVTIGHYLRSTLTRSIGDGLSFSARGYHVA